jgi:hypothetical protein
MSFRLGEIVCPQENRRQRAQSFGNFKGAIADNCAR